MQALIVEDDPFVGEVITSITTSTGLPATLASEPVKALDNILQMADQPLLIISDFDLPQMTGLKLIEQARKIHPKVCAILMSGKEPLDIPEDIPFLHKPFPPENLIELIQRFST